MDGITSGGAFGLFSIESRIRIINYYYYLLELLLELLFIRIIIRIDIY